MSAIVNSVTPFFYPTEASNADHPSSEAEKEITPKIEKNEVPPPLIMDPESGGQKFLQEAEIVLDMENPQPNHFERETQAKFCLVCLEGTSNAFENAYRDNRRSTLNSLLRIKTPRLERKPYEEIAANVASCMCTPLKYIEGLGMIVLGVAACPVPCCAYKLKTHHHGHDATIRDVSSQYFNRYFNNHNLSCSNCIKAPCVLIMHFEDDYREAIPPAQSVNPSNHLYRKTNTSGYSCAFAPCGQQALEGEIDNAIYSVSSLTGYNCITSGIGKIVGASFAALHTTLCTPVSLFCLAWTKERQGTQGHC
jgi:hypothetical protein